jgi:hypothetical protein
MGFNTHEFLVAMMADSTIVRLRMQKIPAKGCRSARCSTANWDYE